MNGFAIDRALYYVLMISDKNHESMLRALVANEIKEGPARIEETWEGDFNRGQILR